MVGKINVETREIEGKTWFKFNNKFEETRYFKGNQIAVALIIVLLVMGSSLFIYIQSNLQKLKANPFIYSANKVMGNVECSCVQTLPNEFPIFFCFNKTDWTPGE